jgi:NADPH:quinone reductase-like Zn-dependent oxidoreductase
LADEPLSHSIWLFTYKDTISTSKATCRLIILCANTPYTGFAHTTRFFARMAEAVRNGKLAIPVARTFRLSEAAAAQQLAETGHIDGKVVLVP